MSKRFSEFDGDDHSDDGGGGDIHPDGDHHIDHHRHDIRPTMTIEDIRAATHHHHHHHHQGDDNEDSRKKQRKTVALSKATTVHAFGEDEGLGDDFRKSAWKEPSVEKAKESLAENMFRAGKADLWKTGIEEINENGTGIGAYFMLVKSFTKMMFVSTILALPHMVFARSGRYGEDAWATKNDLNYQLFKHSAGHHAYVAPKSTQMVYCGSEANGYKVDTVFEAGVDCSTEWLYKVPLLTTIGMSSDLIRARHASVIIVVCDVLNTILMMLFLYFTKMRVKWMLLKHSGTACDVSSFAVHVRGLPKDATTEEIIDHFSNIYQLDKPDWNHRGACCGCIGLKKSRRPEDILFPSGKKGEKKLKPVQKGKALNSEVPKLYNGKWAAEVVVVHPMDSFLRVMARNAAKSRHLLLDRARVKKCTRFEDDFGGARRLAQAEKKLEKTEKSIEKTKKRLQGMKRMLHNMDNVCVGAFVVFNHEESLKRCLEDYSRKPFFHRLCFGQHKQLRFRGTHTLKVRLADKPGNILWENINISRFESRLRRSLGSFAAFVCLVISFVVIFTATSQQRGLSEDIPTTDMCTDFIPSVYTGTTSVTWLYEKDKCSDPTEFYITFEEAPAEYKSASLENDCVAPCISEKDAVEHTCTHYADSSKSYEFSPKQVLYCYCIDKLSVLVAEKGYTEGPRELVNDEVCGDFARDYAQVQTLTSVVSVVIPIVNEILKLSIKWIGNFQRYKTTTSRSISVSVNTFFALYINTALLLLLVNGKLRIYANIHLNKDNSIASSDYDEFWYTTVGLAIVNIMVLNIIIPHIGPYAKNMLEPLRRALHGNGITQYQLDEFYLGEKFRIEEKGAQLMQTLAVTLTFSPGLPVLYPIAFLSLLLMYWCDKYLLLRVNTRPIVVQGELGRRLLKLMPYLLIVHLANAFWMYAYRPSQGYDGQVNNQNSELEEGGEGNIGGVFDAELQNSHPEFYNNAQTTDYTSFGLFGPLMVRLNRIHCIPIFVIFVLLAVWFVVVGRLLGFVLWVLVKCACSSKADADKTLASQRQFNPAFTEKYLKQVQEKWSFKMKKWVPRKLPTLDGQLGWRQVIKDGHTYIAKLKEGGGGASYETTWEVVKDAGLHTYQMRYNDVYKNVFVAYDHLLAEKDEETGDVAPPAGASGKVAPVMPS